MFKKSNCPHILLMTNKEGVEAKVEEAIRQYCGPQEVCRATELLPDFLEIKSKGDTFVRTDFYNNGQIDARYYEVMAGKHGRVSKYLNAIPDKTHLRVTLICKDDACILTTLAKRGDKIFINLVNKEHISAMYLGNDCEKAKTEYEFLVRSIHSILGE